MIAVLHPKINSLSLADTPVMTSANNFVFVNLIEKAFQ